MQKCHYKKHGERPASCSLPPEQLSRLPAERSLLFDCPGNVVGILQPAALKRDPCGWIVNRGRRRSNRSSQQLAPYIQKKGRTPEDVRPAKSTGVTETLLRLRVLLRLLVRFLLRGSQSLLNPAVRFLRVRQILFLGIVQIAAITDKKIHIRHGIFIIGID